MSLEQVDDAYMWWLGEYPFREADQRVAEFLSQTRNGEWVRRARRAQMLSTSEMARRLGVTRQAYVQFEGSESRGTIRLKSLIRVAEAMDCEVIYAIRPKFRIPYSRVVWNQIINGFAEKMVPLPGIHPKTWARAWGSSMGQRLNDPIFRRRMGWNKRKQ